MAGCINNASDQEEIIVPEFIEHENGLSAYIYFEYVSNFVTDNGFYFDANVTGSRGGDTLKLELLQGDDIENYQDREIDCFPYQYRIEEIFGGNGPPQYQLTIWKSAGEKVIRLRNYVQKEGEPDFTKSWSLIESATVNGVQESSD